MSNTRWWPTHLMMGWLNLVLTAPIIYLYVGLPLVLRQQGWSGTEIGLLQLAGLPAILKFVLATPIDRYRLGRFNYHNWALVLGLCYALLLVVLATRDLQQTPRAQLFVLALLVNLLGTWVDVPVNALAIQAFPSSERMRAGAVRSAALSIAAIVGGGVLLLVHARYGWAAPWQILAIGLLTGALMLPSLRSVKACRAQTGSDEVADWSQWPRYFSEPGRRRWAGLLLCYFPFIGAVWVYLKPLLLDNGFSAGQIAVLVGIAGGLLAAAASLAAAYLVRRLGAVLALPLFALINLLAVAILCAALGFGLGRMALGGAAMAIAVAMGASSALMLTLMMFHTRPGMTALDYGIQSSVFIAARTLVPLFAGVLLDHFGYTGMLAGLALGLSLALVLAWHQRLRVHTGNAERALGLP